MSGDDHSMFLASPKQCSDTPVEKKRTSPSSCNISWANCSRMLSLEKRRHAQALAWDKFEFFRALFNCFPDIFK